MVLKNKPVGYEMETRMVMEMETNREMGSKELRLRAETAGRVFQAQKLVVPDLGVVERRRELFSFCFTFDVLCDRLFGGSRHVTKE